VEIRVYLPELLPALDEGISERISAIDTESFF
jgi:hypothetical protein